MSFSGDLSRFSEKAMKRQTRVVRGVALSALSSAILISPVDTGRFRGNWNTAIGSADTSTSETTDPSGQGTLSRGQSTIGRAQLGDTIVISNNLPYAKRLNEGWSQQAPTGIIPIIRVQFAAFLVDAVGAAKQEVP